jgi:hypothetical protein
LNASSFLVPALDEISSQIDPIVQYLFAGDAAKYFCFLVTGRFASASTNFKRRPIKVSSFRQEAFLPYRVKRSGGEVLNVQFGKSGSSVAVQLFTVDYSYARKKGDFCH